MNVDSARYCSNCGASIRTDANFCEQCGLQIDPPHQSGPQTPTEDPRPDGHSREQSVQVGQPNNPPSQPPYEQSGPAPPRQPVQIPDHYGHLFGDVYYDKRARYALLEGAGAILLLLPPGVFSDIFRTPLRWLLENNPRALLWVLQNYQMIGFGIFIAGIASRITIDPEPIEIEREVSEETTEGTNKETIEETSEETTEETSEEDKSFFTLYWLGLD